MKKNVLILLLVLSSLPSQAYLLKLDTILSRTSENYGKHYYIIKKEILIPETDKPFSKITETWYVKDSHHLFVHFKHISDTPFEGAILYKYGKKYYLDENKKLKEERLGVNFFEPFFVYRKTQNIRKILSKNNILPRSSHTEDKNFVHLTRKLNTLHYLIGTPSKESLKPGLWIEQDMFFIRFLRLKSLAEVTTNNFKNLGSFHFPSILKVQWKGKKVIVKNVRVKILKRSNKYFSVRYLYKTNAPLITSSFSETAGAFYKHFR